MNYYYYGMVHQVKSQHVVHRSSTPFSRQISRNNDFVYISILSVTESFAASPPTTRELVLLCGQLLPRVMLHE